MKYYNIESIEQDRYMVFSTNYVSPLDFIKDIERELKRFVNQKIEIIFDLILSTGNNSQRFAKVCFNGESIDTKSFEFVKVDKKDSIRRLSAQYYKKNNELLESSILPSTQKKLLKCGIAI